MDIAWYVFLGVTIGLLIRVALTLRKKKKEKEKEKEKEKAAREEMCAVFNKELEAATDVEFPELYFEKFFIRWMPNKENSDEKNYSIVKSYFDYINTSNLLDSFFNGLSVLKKDAMGYSLFLKNEEEYNNYYFDKTAEDVSNEIVLCLPLYSATRRAWSNIKLCVDAACKYNDFKTNYMYGILLAFQNNITTKEEEALFKSALTLVVELREYVCELKWKKIVSAHSEWDTQINRELFIERFQSTDSSLWIKFYAEKWMEFDEKIGIRAFQEVILPRTEEFADNIMPMVKDGVSKYSSIYEIDDFSEENTNRIVELYKNGIISGVYSKSKDPKYCS